MLDAPVSGGVREQNLAAYLYGWRKQNDFDKLRFLFEYMGSDLFIAVKTEVGKLQKFVII